ncbi:Uncharacterised protein [Vibrio cholerae]|nr:Uncharacterised protein [Vibrio cholerae]CSC32273.1 Uncharacterised protein [Vibrio cholerae]CSD10356.1 Uncharacterised protein [Vibrio cholerae]
MQAIDEFVELIRQQTHFVLATNIQTTSQIAIPFGDIRQSISDITELIKLTSHKPRRKQCHHKQDTQPNPDLHHQHVIQWLLQNPFIHHHDQ